MRDHDDRTGRARHTEDYYMVTSSFSFYPGVPIFHSRDLAHWEQIGYVPDRPSQLPLNPDRISGGIYAPTLLFHDGLYYMITTNVSDGGNFIVTAEKPEGPHIYKKDGYYYLMVAEGGTEHFHSESIARAESFWGSYESFRGNPFLTQRHLGMSAKIMDTGRFASGNGTEYNEYVPFEYFTYKGLD